MWQNTTAVQANIQANLAISTSDSTAQSVSDAAIERAERVAANLQLPLFSHDNAKDQPALKLLVSEDRLSVQLRDMQPFALDFSEKSQRHRLFNTTRKQEPLAKALQLRNGMLVLDATAGTGRDGVLLAALGAKVTMAERQPVLHALLADALERMTADTKLQSIVARCSLVNTDSADMHWLHSTLPTIDAIYCDPMFPERTNSAKVKKLAQVLHHLAGDDIDQHDQAETLLRAAQSHRCERLVIKRPRTADYLTSIKPDHQIVGRSTRFDVYYTRK